MAIVDGVAYGWQGRGEPLRQLDGTQQVGVSQDAYFALRSDGVLLSWTSTPATATELMQGVAAFAAGASGWRGIDRQGALWHAATGGAPQRVAENVMAACIGDSADYHITRDGQLWVQGLAHRGQYGDGLLTSTLAPLVTAQDATVVRAHTGHAIHLRRDGTVMGTGGNRFGPLSHHGLGDKADRWGAIFSGAVAIATGSRHSLAIRADGSLWAWGDGFKIEPIKLMDGVSEVAGGDTVTLALTRDGALWQWDHGGKPRRLPLRDSAPR